MRHRATILATGGINCCEGMTHGCFRDIIAFAELLAEDWKVKPGGTIVWLTSSAPSY
jgi:hypothetical protein